MTNTTTTSFEHEPQLIQAPEALEAGYEKELSEPLGESLAVIDEATDEARHELPTQDPNSLPVVEATQQILLHNAENAVIEGRPHEEIIDTVEAASTFGLLRHEGMLPGSDGANVIEVMEAEGLGDELKEVEKSFEEKHVVIGTVEAAPEMKKILDAHPDIETDTVSQIEFIEAPSPERTANYQGNWTQLQTERTSSPDFKAKLKRFIEEGSQTLDNEPLTSEGFPKKGPNRDQYEGRVDQYDTLHANVTSKVEYGPAAQYDKQPKFLGTVHGYDELDPTVALFTDAASKGEPLTDKQKDIIVAHEMYHGLMKPEGGNVAQIRDAFDLGVYNEVKQAARAAGQETPSGSYMMNPSELTARMAQAKNYFGMKGNETFTQPHLDYLRENYVKDTELNNDMQLFLNMAKDKQFVDLMNTIPV